jgi:hypothetical protein
MTENMCYEVSFEGGNRFVIAGSDKEALAKFKDQWEEDGEREPEAWVSARWAVQS